MRQGNFGRPPVNEGDEVDVTIEAVGEKGDGIAKVEGFVVFVPNTKAGDSVRIKISKVLRNVGFGEVIGQASAPAGSEEPDGGTDEGETKEGFYYDESLDSETFGDEDSEEDGSEESDDDSGEEKADGSEEESSEDEEKADDSKEEPKGDSEEESEEEPEEDSGDDSKEESDDSKEEPEEESDEDSDDKK